MDDFSDNALLMWFAFFRVIGSSLSFGGRDAVLAITPEGRAALDYLLKNNVCEPTEPTTTITGREYYQSLGRPIGDLKLEIEKRGIDLLSPDGGVVFFEK